MDFRVHEDLEVILELLGMTIQECIIPLHPFLRLSASRKSGSQY